MQGKIRGVYVPGGNQLLNVYFANDGAMTSELTQNYPHAMSDTKRQFSYMVYHLTHAQNIKAAPSLIQSTY